MDTNQPRDPVGRFSESTGTAPDRDVLAPDDTLTIDRSTLVTMLDRLNHLTTEEFSNGADRPIRLTLARALGIGEIDYDNGD